MKNYLHYVIHNGFFTLIYIFFLSSTSNAQHFMIGDTRFKIEAGLNFGPTFFLGDLGGHRGKGTTFVKDLNLPLTKLMKGAFISFSPSEWLSFRVAAQYTYVEGQDRIIKTDGRDELYRKQRNLDFKSDMFEAYAAIEVFPLMLLNANNEGYAPRVRPYIFAGVGMFKFNPMGSISDQNGNQTWYELQPLRTEGQGFKEYPSRKPYSLKQLNIPMGGGLKYFASSKLNLSLELLYRKTFTDYIDDLSTDYVDPNLFYQNLRPERAAIASQIFDKAFTSLIAGSPRFEPGLQRGNPKNMDAYFSFVLKLGLRLGDAYEGSPSRRGAGSTKCPSRF